jgi:alpha-ketoglutarate-dependent taurine dioxygenase
MNNKYLTTSGIGIKLTKNEFKSCIPSEITTLLDRHGFIVTEGLQWERADLQEYFLKLGDLVHNKQRNQETFLELNGKMEAKEVLRGTGRMPLHRDGLMMQDNVKYVGIYCIDIEVSEGGRTYISDTMKAWKEVPEEIKIAIKENGIEILPQDTTYYLKNEEKWYAFKGIITYHNEDVLNGGLSYRPEEKKSYEIRIPNIAKELSSQYFDTIESVFNLPKFTYYHTWQKGDLLLMNNFSTMHGREAYSGSRNIVQIQVRI